MKFAVSSFALAAVLTSGGIAFAQSPAPKAAPVTLHAQNSSGESGSATLTQSGSDVVVSVHITGSGSTAQPIHIHEGTCAKLNPKPAYPLTTVQDGASTTTLKNMTVSQLETGAYAINVHKSTSDPGTYVACGDIPKSGTM